MDKLMKFFKVKENGSDFKTELFAGLTTFMTMAYILAVNPSILESAGMDKAAVFTATALSSALATFLMAIFANYPFALGPGMGLNAYFAYVVAAKFGWEIALMAVFVEGIIFMVLSVVRFRETIFEAIPMSLKRAVGVGIGLFICFIGFQNSGIIVANESTALALGNIKDTTVIFTMIGIIITIVLLIRNVKGALFWGILITYFIGVIAELMGIYQVNPEMGMHSLIPESIIAFPPSPAKASLFTAVKTLDFSKIRVFDFLTVVFAFLFVDIFDTIGTLIGVSNKAGFLDADGNLPKLKESLLADAIGTTAGALMGTSTVSTFVESAAGVAEGGRTGLTSLVTATLFMLSLFFWPIIKLLPSFATAPALIVVGLFMIEEVREIDFSDYSEGFPAFITIVMMPFAYSISDGIIFGFLSYIIIKVLIGKAKEISAVMFIIGLIFFLKLILS